MERNKHKNIKTGKNESLMLSALVGGGIGIATTLMTVLISPFALLKSGDPNALTSLAAAIAIFMGGTAGSVTAAKKCGDSPISAGLLSSAILLLPIILVSFFIPGTLSFPNIGINTASLVGSALVGSFFVSKSKSNKKRSMKKALKPRKR